MRKKFTKLCSAVISSAMCVSANCLPICAHEKLMRNASQTGSSNSRNIDDNSHYVVENLDNWNILFKEINKIESESIKEVVRSRVAEALQLTAFQDIINSPKRVLEMNDQDLEINLIDAFGDTVSGFNLSKGNSPVPFEIKTEQDIEKDFIGLSYISSHCQDFRYYKALNYIFKMGVSCDLAKLYCIKSGIRSSQLRKNRRSNYESLKKWCNQNKIAVRNGLGHYAVHLGVSMDL